MAAASSSPLVAHAVEGTVAPHFSGSNGFTGADQTRWTLLYTAGWCLVADAVVIFDRRTWPTGERKRLNYGVPFFRPAAE